MKPSRFRLVKSIEKRPVAAGRRPNAVYRVREHLTEDEMARLLAALSASGTASATLPKPCQHHQHGALHRNVA